MRRFDFGMAVTLPIPASQNATPRGKGKTSFPYLQTEIVILLKPLNNFLCHVIVMSLVSLQQCVCRTA